MLHLKFTHALLLLASTGSSIPSKHHHSESLSPLQTHILIPFMTYSSLEYSASLTRQEEEHGIYVTCWKRTRVLHFLNLIVRFLDPKHIFSSLQGSEYSGQHNKGVFSHCSILNDYVPTRYHFLDAASSLEKLFST